MKYRLFIFVVIVSLCLMSLPTQGIQAAAGTPGSPQFGYGAHYYQQGNPAALQTAAELQLSWINLNYSWQAISPTPDAQADLAQMDQVMAYLQERQISVLLSLTNPPAWALTPQGPNPQITANLLAFLVKRYPGLQAVELFPGANTQSGWGAQPDPLAYTNLFLSVQNTLKTTAPHILLVAGGLKPGAEFLDTRNIAADVYLRGLYSANKAPFFNILSLQMDTISGDPFAPPENPFSLRNYEKIRQVMVDNQHTDGIIWITHLVPPSGKINSEDQRFIDQKGQDTWLTQAFTQLRSQLYIGVAFLDGLNSAPGSENTFSLVAGNKYHPFYTSFKALIYQNGADTIKRGRPKSSILVKKRN